jgi:AP-3 complex subunit delta-1
MIFLFFSYKGTRHGKLLASQMLDVAIRVESIRPFIVMQMAILLDNIHVFTANSASNHLLTGKNTSSDVCEVLYAATWICGEFCEHLSDPVKTMEAMLKSKVTNLPGHIQSAFIQNVFKLYSHIITRIYTSSNEASEESQEFLLSPDGLEECKQMTRFVSERIVLFEQSTDIEVQERACTMIQILKYVQKVFDKQQLHENDVDNQDG